MRLAVLLLLSAALPAQEITGELRQWHDIVLTFSGPEASEEGDPNPFLDYRLDVTFTQGDESLIVPGYFAADGDAAETGTTAGDQWRVHFVPRATGEWRYQASFRSGPGVAVSDDPAEGEPAGPDGVEGSFTILPSDKTGRDHRAHGMLEYVGEHYARYAGSGEYFIQVGAQSPENFLAYYEFDGTEDHGGAENRLQNGLHHYEPHLRDWRPGDPTWRGGKGKGIIGALNYLASKGMNTFYTLTMNVGGDGREIYPWTSYDERVRYDVSKLAQWEIVLSHMDRLGMQLMLITQEEENEQLLGKLTPERKLYLRELVARFAHHHALLWDLSEEADRWRYYSAEDLKAMCNYLKALDPWDHPIQYVQWKGELIPDDKGYARLLGFENFDGTALQHDAERTHEQTLQWVRRSAAAGHKWLVGLIEINPIGTGVVPDSEDFWHDRVRKNSIWGNLMAGGSGSVYFFGFRYPHSDLDLEDWRSRDHFWDLQRHAHEFFTRYLPFHEMEARDELTPATDDFVFAKEGEVYAIYLPNGGPAVMDLSGVEGEFDLDWYDPRNGGVLKAGLRKIPGGRREFLGFPPDEGEKDWVALLRPAAPSPAPPEPLTGGVGGERMAVFSILGKLRQDLVVGETPQGTPVTLSVISPESLLGASLKGVVASSSPLQISFRTLRHDDVDHPVVAWAWNSADSIVNSTGRPGAFESGVPIAVVDNALASPTPQTVAEGAEMRLSVRLR